MRMAERVNHALTRPRHVLADVAARHPALCDGWMTPYASSAKTSFARSMPSLQMLTRCELPKMSRSTCSRDLLQNEQRKAEG